MAASKKDRTIREKLARSEPAAEIIEDRLAPEGEPDAVAIFYLLYPMLSDGGKQTTEAIKALRIVSKYLPEKTVKFMWKCLKLKPPSRVSRPQSVRAVNSV